MSRRFMRKKMAAALASFLLLELCPFAPGSVLPLASAATIVHDRPHQRGGGEFYRISDKGNRPFSEKYGEESEAASKEEAEEEQPKAELSNDEQPKTEEQKSPEPVKSGEMLARMLEEAAKRAEIQKPIEPPKAETPKEEPPKEERPKAETDRNIKTDKQAEPDKQSEPVAQPPAVSLQQPPVERTAAVAEPVAMKPWPMKTHDIGGTLLLSDNPESAEKPGIYYTDQVKGDVRALYYQVNESKKDFRTAIVLENKGEAHAVVHVTRLGISEPSPDYLAVGKATQLAYFGKQTAAAFILAPGERRVLSREQQRQLMKPADLTYGCIDFTVSNPVIASLLVYDAKKNPLTYLDEAPIIKATDNTLRGSYTGMNRLMTGAKEYRPARDGVVYFHIGDGDADKFRSGIDATDGSIMTNNGNYGIVYNITIPCKGGFNAYLAPRGGVYAGAINVETDGDPGTARMVETPKGSGWDFGVSGLPASSNADKEGKCLLTPEDEVTLIGHFEPKEALRLEMTPPGASNLSVRIILVPDGLEPLASDAKRG